MLYLENLRGEGWRPVLQWLGRSQVSKIGPDGAAMTWIKSPGATVGFQLRAMEENASRGSLGPFQPWRLGSGSPGWARI